MATHWKVPSRSVSGEFLGLLEVVGSGSAAGLRERALLGSLSGGAGLLRLPSLAWLAGRWLLPYRHTPRLRVAARTRHVRPHLFGTLLRCRRGREAAPCRRRGRRAPAATVGFWGLLRRGRERCLHCWLCSRGSCDPPAPVHVVGTHRSDFARWLGLEGCFAGAVQTATDSGACWIPLPRPSRRRLCPAPHTFPADRLQLGGLLHFWAAGRGTGIRRGPRLALAGGA
mmetsp:Transcript_68900/g.161470  ORF Transcript_68900/g.161470 Transcript_68900/m.161470 type:complete len:227 (+) Transcript_68900:250-930(+)